MTYAVTISYDGSHRGTINGPMSATSYDQCVHVVSTMLPPTGYQFEIRNNENGRLMSYVVQRRRKTTRLRMCHFNPN